jgi:hypothetical protein
MLIGYPLACLVIYVDRINESLEQHPHGRGLTVGQKSWLSFCLIGILVTESVCWQKFVRAGLGRYSEALLSRYFCGPMCCTALNEYRSCVGEFRYWEGVLDNTSKKRSKVTRWIPYVYYFKNKEGSGTSWGQEIVILVLVTPLLSIPVAIAFYQPDPAYSAWARQDKLFKRQGIAKSKRQAKPSQAKPSQAKPSQASRESGLSHQTTTGARPFETVC